VRRENVFGCDPIQGVGNINGFILSVVVLSEVEGRRGKVGEQFVAGLVGREEGEEFGHGSRVKG
jgi:hypothetical protein